MSVWGFVIKEFKHVLMLKNLRVLILISWVYCQTLAKTLCSEKESTITLPTTTTAFHTISNGFPVNRNLKSGFFLRCLQANTQVLLMEP